MFKKKMTLDFYRVCFDVDGIGHWFRFGFLKKARFR
jgi:hypothetical protein